MLDATVVLELMGSFQAVKILAALKRIGEELSAEEQVLLPHIEHRI
jgi:hypothetical protein